MTGHLEEPTPPLARSGGVARTTRRGARALTLAGALLGLGACAIVPPYERGRLVTRAMKSKPALDAAFDAHVAELRESAVGAASAEGASCGCR